MVRTPIFAMLALTCAVQAQAAEIRVCESEIRTLPLSDERGAQSALVQGLAVVNTGTVREQLAGVNF